MIKPEIATQLIAENLTLVPEHLAINIMADRDYPPFDRVMMDGIAVDYEAYQQGLRDFKIVGVAAAGEAAKILNHKEHCFEVMTGAPLPKGASLVIPYEHLELASGVAKIVKELQRAKMESIHLKGSDCKRGELVLKSGVALNGPHQGIASSMGEEFSFSPSSRLLIISTGDELVDIGTQPLEHQIRRSNAYAIRQSLKLNGFSDVTLNHLKDDPNLISDHYLENAEKYDVLIYSGGVSKGKFDYLPNVWSELGVKKIFHEVAQRPGKPLWFGVDEKRNCRVVGLPGNPVSSLVCLHRYVIPKKSMYARLSEEIIFKKDLTYFIPVKLEYRADGSLLAHPMRIKNSGEFTALAESDGFLELPAEQSVFSPGEVFSYWPWRIN